MLRFLILILLVSQPLFAQLPDSLRNAVFTRYYGNKPANLEFLNLKENIDSLAIQIWADRSKNAASHDFSFNFLDPDFPEFTASLAYRFHPDYGNLAEFQNFFRWVRRFDARRFVLINIASQQLTFYEDNIPVLQMNVIVGTAKNKTPRLATLADAAVVYPYWTATRNIALNEILPKVKADVNYLSRNNFEVLDTKGKVIDPLLVNWNELNASSFSYRFRQGTGCENSLGLLKINIQNPYSVYMHDTPHTTASQSLFDRKNRYFSHGCIRLQKPLELVNLLKPTKRIDQNLMDYCLRNQKPETIELEKPIPVFIMYFTDYINENGEWKTAGDYYRLNQKTDKNQVSP